MTDEDIEKLEKLLALKEGGVLSEDEFAQQKAKLLDPESGGSSQPIGRDTRPAAQVSDTGRAPDVGEARPKKGGGVSIVRILLLLVLFGVLGALFVGGGGLALLAGGGGGSSGGGAFAPAPDFRISGELQFGDCSTFLDHCVEVRCTVENRGDAAGRARVRFTYERAGKPNLTANVTTDLIGGNGGIGQASYDFTDASITDGKSGARCQLL